MTKQSDLSKIEKLVAEMESLPNGALEKRLIAAEMEVNIAELRNEIEEAKKED